MSFAENPKFSRNSGGPFGSFNRKTASHPFPINMHVRGTMIVRIDNDPQAFDAQDRRHETLCIKNPSGWE